MLDPFTPLPKGKTLEPGTIVRRIGEGKDQQGHLLHYDEEGNMVLANILDMAEGTLLAAHGLLKPRPGDRLYYYASSFTASPASGRALALVRKWPLFIRHRGLQERIISFITAIYAPEQIVQFEKNDSLPFLFVPIQQMFRIGRYSERRDPERLCNEAFMIWLESLQRGDHITYLALVMEQKHHVPRFYSIGTKPHEETASLLKNEEYNFRPTHGGHIKAMGVKDGLKHFIVDAGSTYLGRGVRTPLHVAIAAAAALKKVYPDFEFTPLEGRGAFGTQQSY
ncbi:MAG: hypothetical protein E4G96_04665 [Chrysiogenales bacterium]|nr:MAG: hypothetical protein E4G96_04665 [Chrysiogenales bacterium]